MTSLSAVLLVVAAFFAAGNWWSRITGDRRAAAVERITKPLTMVALIGTAIAVDADDSTVRWWFVAGLVLSLAGDVFLLDGERWFLAGLGSFLVAHMATIVGLVLADPWRWWGVAVAVVLVAALVATAGSRIVAGAIAQAAGLRIPVVAYLSVISILLVVATAAGNAWAIAGAASFVASDTILGWHRFVEARRWMSPVIMITYHLAQAGLVLSLL